MNGTFTVYNGIPSRAVSEECAVGRSLGHMIRVLLATMLALYPFMWTEKEVQAGPGDQATAEIISIDDSRFPEITLLVSILDATGKPLLGVPPSAIKANDTNLPAQVVSVESVIDKGIGVAVVL